MAKCIFMAMLLIASPCFAENGITIHAKIDKNFSTKYIAVINFEIINDTQNWEELSNFKISFSEEADRNIEVLDGEKLYIWADYAEVKERDLRASNKLWSEFLFGKSYSDATQPRGESNVLKHLKDSKLGYPKEHIYSGRLIIPPGLVVRRYIVIS